LWDRHYSITAVNENLTVDDPGTRWREGMLRVGVGKKEMRAEECGRRLKEMNR